MTWELECHWLVQRRIIELPMNEKASKKTVREPSREQRGPARYGPPLAARSRSRVPSWRCQDKRHGLVVPERNRTVIFSSQYPRLCHLPRPRPRKRTVSNPACRLPLLSGSYTHRWSRAPKISIERCSPPCMHAVLVLEAGALLPRRHLPPFIWTACIRLEWLLPRL